jgi:hypothetical protein
LGKDPLARFEIRVPTWIQDRNRGRNPAAEGVPVQTQIIRHVELMFDVAPRRLYWPDSSGRWNFQWWGTARELWQNRWATGKKRRSSYRHATIAKTLSAVRLKSSRRSTRR